MLIIFKKFEFFFSESFLRYYTNNCNIQLDQNPEIDILIEKYASNFIQYKKSAKLSTPFVTNVARSTLFAFTIVLLPFKWNCNNKIVATVTIQRKRSSPSIFNSVTLFKENLAHFHGDCGALFVSKLSLKL